MFICFSVQKYTQLTTDTTQDNSPYDALTDREDWEDDVFVFGKQVELAQKHGEDYTSHFHQNYALAQEGKGGDPKYWKDFMHASDMSSFMNAAYDSPDGYSIRVNPLTGMKEMMIAGTHSPTTVKGMKEWASNIAEGLDSATFHAIPVLNDVTVHREAFGEKLAQIAADEGVQVVYGHSRGAAIMSHFDETKFIGIGIDGATYIGEAKQKFINVNAGKQVFDRAIGAFNKRTVHVKGVKFHDVTRSKYKYKKSKPLAKTKEKPKETALVAKQSATKKRPRNDFVQVKRSKQKKEPEFAVGVSLPGGKKAKVIKKKNSAASSRMLRAKVTKKNLSRRKSRRRL